MAYFPDLASYAYANRVQPGVVHIGCGNTLTDPIFATSHFIADRTHGLWRYSDAVMHWDCYVLWPNQAKVASMYIEAAVKQSESDPWPKYWSVLLKSPNVLVLYGFAVNEVSVVLRKSGTDMRVSREMWQHWLRIGWREDCRPGLEYDAIAEISAQLAQLTLPEQTPPAAGPT